MVVNEWNILDEEIILGCSLAGFKWKLVAISFSETKGIYISFSFLPLYRQLDDVWPAVGHVWVRLVTVSK